eukprot:1158524-Pelagomonas_calceolata.AAC.7
MLTGEHAQWPAACPAMHMHTNAHAYVVWTKYDRGTGPGFSLQIMLDGQLYALQCTGQPTRLQDAPVKGTLAAYHHRAKYDLCVLGALDAQHQVVTKEKGIAEDLFCLLDLSSKKGILCKSPVTDLPALHHPLCTRLCTNQARACAAT